MMQLMMCVAGGVIAGVIIIASLLLDGIVVKNLWEWFIVPLGTKPISLFHAIGISLIASVLTYQFTPSKKEELMERLWFLFAMPLFALFLGWGVKSLM